MNSSLRKKFIITIDTEADNQWDSNHECSTENAEYLPRFQELAEKYGYKPVWLTTYEMAENEYFVNYFKNKQDANLCEIGMHLHAWNTPPSYNLESKTKERSYLIEYPLEVMEEKIKSLDNLLLEKFNVKPISHRSGRWATNEEYFKLLKKYGYKMDCSITPHINWKNSLGQTGISGSDYSKESEKPNEIYENILEIPMTIKKVHMLDLKKSYSLKKKFKKIIRYIIGQKQWVRPSNSFDISGIKRVIDICNKNGEYVMFMIHSSELMPNGSPNFKNEADIEKLYKNIDDIFSYVKSLGYEGITLRDYYKELVK